LTIERKLFHRPGANPSDLLLIEDSATGQVVSSVSLLKQAWTYEGIPLPVGEVGIVSTRPEYRKQGLVRVLFDAYHRLARREGCILSVISGIPYFYRQFGYTYALPMGGGWRLHAEQIPKPEGPASHYSVRRAGPGDEATLQTFYRAAVQGLCMASVLESDIWAYQDALPEKASDRKETYLIEKDGLPCGYWRINANEEGWDKGVVFHAAYLPHYELCLEALRFARDLALARQEHTVALQVPLDIPLAQTMRDFGAEPVRGYAWYVRILDPVRLMLTIAPVLEQRLACSPLAGLDEVVRISLYREALLLRFRKGRLLSVALSPDVRHADFRLPPDVAPLWWLGYRSMGELLAWYPDVSCRNRAQERLAEVLFPPRPSWVASVL
ncbi:MAG: GNAT family N-acetyltransferase, partial [Chloroflexi bacterium]|nr:GNAT family N-acetyltransferase [Chloroflexota bacterium]